MAKDIPAVTFSVLIPITSPSYSNRHKSENTNANVNSHKHTAHLLAQCDASDIDHYECTPVFMFTDDSIHSLSANNICFQAHKDLSINIIACVHSVLAAFCHSS